MEVRTRQFVASAHRALNDPQVQAALALLRERLGRAPQMSERELTPAIWQELRQRASDIKRHAIAHLDYYLGQLDVQVTRAGGVVHYARDAAQANEIVTDIARRQGVRLVIKSKSMVSEEMGINPALEEMGIQSVETDLGEYIIQLARERPFHIIAPALHKTRQEVSDLFTAKLGTPAYEQADELCQVARRTLRERFLGADMGMTGVNFAVAETGTIVVVTNEGNGRMCTSLPRVHVAVMGMEKVIPRLEDLAVLLTVLPRAATGQRASSYFTFITGPRRSSDEDGPEEFHLVILDNGRSRILADRELRESLHCIRCGACLNACPVYRKVGGHAYGWVYSGPIGAVVTPLMVGTAQARDLPFASTLCGACRDVCPVKINLPHLLLRLRREVTQGGPTTRKTRVGWWERALMKGWLLAVKSPGAFALAGRLGRLALLPLTRQGRVRRLPPPLSGWTRFRDFPPPAARPFRQRWREGMGQQESEL